MRRESDHESSDQSIETLDSTTNIRERLNDQLRVDPVVETTKLADLSVHAAARFYKKSPRQIQRLLKSGMLHGYKINGPKGPEWRVSRDQSSASQPRLDQPLPILTHRLEELNDKLNAIESEYQAFSEVIKRLESHLNEHLKSGEYLKSEVGLLKDQTSRNQSDIKELRILKDQHAAIEFVASEVRNHRQAIKDLADKQVKTPWWKK